MLCINATALHAVVLAHDEHEIRAIAPGHDDVLAFTRVRDKWISEEIEPVSIGFDLQRRSATPAPAEDDCICPKELAVHLIRTLFAGGESPAHTSFVFNPEGRHLAIPSAGPQPHFQKNS
jgi:hypothetical protein